MRRFVQRTARLVFAIAVMGLLGSIAHAQPQPLSLRNGATPTGLWGYYDYQSNGMSPGWLYVEKDNPQRIHAVYMLSLAGTDTTTLSANRRVGYSHSTDGGQTWTATREIETGLRLGFPYLQVLADGTPLIVAHGAPSPSPDVRTLLYIGAPNSTEFFRANEFPAATASGRTGDNAGVIWPSFVVNPKNPLEGIFIGSLSRRSGEEEPPLQWTKAELGISSNWKDFGDSTITNTSGGTYVITTSPGGKIGVATFTYGSWDFAGVYFSESTDGGTTWTEPMKVYGREVNGTDTLWPASELDLVYQGEEPHIVSSGAMNNLFAGQQIVHWSPSTGLQSIAFADSTKALGLIRAVGTKAQPNMAYVSYPTISAGDDGQHLVVAFQAAAQTTSSPQTDAVTNEDGFYYFRVWGVGSPDGGKSWGTPFILQDFAGDGTDSASIEYPAASESGRMTNDEFELSLAFQARRNPGMYAFIVTNTDNNNTPADRGRIEPVYQYYQHIVLDESKFAVQQLSADNQELVQNSLTLSGSYPNPTSSSLTVEYSLPVSGDITLALYNTLGTRVLTPVEHERRYVGTYTRTLDLSSLPSGPYRLVLTQNGKSISESVKIVR